MKNNPFTGKSTRTKIFTVITALSIVILLLLSIFATSFTIYGNGYIDLTPEGLYTLRDVMVAACKNILYDADGNPADPGIKVTFCNDPDKLIDNDFTRIVYYMCVAMSKKFDNFTLETVNVNINPNAVQQYKTTSLTKINSTDIIVSCGSRFRILAAEEFWHLGSEKVISYDGEYKLASVMMSLTMIKRPIAYFVTDHGETYYDENDLESEGSIETASFADLLKEKGFEIKTLQLSKLIEDAKAANKRPSIPDDCVLLIVNNPKSDFKEPADADINTFDYVSETELLDRYMSEDRGSIMVAKDYKIHLPNFEDFLAEWGIDFENVLVKDSLNMIETETSSVGNEITFISEYDKNENGYGYAIYGDYVELATAPITVVTDTGFIKSAFGGAEMSGESGSFNTNRIYAPFLYTSSEALYYADNNKDGIYGDIAVDPNKTKPLAVAAVAGRQTTDSDTGNNHYSYIFCAASSSFFSNELIGNASYANYDIMSSLIQNIARLESYADDSLGGLSINNSESFLGKVLVDMEMTEEDKTAYKWDPEKEKQVLTNITYGLRTPAKVIFTVIIAIIPLSIAIVGVVVCVKRKYL